MGNYCLILTECIRWKLMQVLITECVSLYKTHAFESDQFWMSWNFCTVTYDGVDLLSDEVMN